MADMYEEELKKAKSLEELRNKYEELKNQLNGNGKELKKLYRVFEKREFELKLQEYRKLKEELSKKNKKFKKEKLDINIRVTRKFINSRLTTAEHYVALVQRNREGISLMFLRKVKLEENEGYLMLVNRKMKKSWIISAEPLLLERPKFPFGRKLVALHFTLPDYPYTLSLDVDEKLKNLILKSINAPTIIHSLVKTKFFEALARAGGGIDYTMLIMGAIMGIGIGTAIGFGVANANLSHLLVHHLISTTTSTTTPPITTNTTSSSKVVVS
jgi:hypothetical protein